MYVYQGLNTAKHIMSDYKFICKTRDGIILKPLIEMIGGLTTSLILFITAKGINSYVLNGNKRILLRNVMPASKFEKYTCNEHQIRIMVIVDELYTHLKSIKKKNALTLFIENQTTDQFGIAIDIHGENVNSNISRIKMLEVYDSVCLNTDYVYKYIYKINSKELQRAIKEMAKLSDVASIYGCKSHMGIMIMEGNMVKKEYRFNIIDNRDADNKTNTYKKTIDTSLLNDISKGCAITKTITVYMAEGLPIKFEIESGSIINTEIYIKTNDLVEEPKLPHSNK